MRDPNRIQRILGLLDEVWRANPDMRLGQLVDNLLQAGPQLWVIEDDDLQRRLAAVVTNGWTFAALPRGDGE